MSTALRSALDRVEHRAGSHRPHLMRLRDLALPDRLLILLPLVAGTLWTLSFLGTNPEDMGQLGLLSLFSAWTVVALVVLAGGVVLALHRGASEGVLALHLVTFLCLVHGTPAALYGTLRYAWAYKHVGIVDYILRTGSVDPEIAVGGIYHNWPGFFAGAAVLTAAAGEVDATVVASWSPLVFNLANLLVLRYVYRGLTRNDQLIWLSLWVYFIITWVGQDYFSPQAMAYLLYLACIGLLIRRSARWPVLAVFTAAGSAVAVSHQITPIMLVIAVTALVLLRRIAGWHLPLVALGLVLAWAVTGAAEYTLPNLRAFFDTFGQPIQNAGENLAKGAERSGAQRLVVWGGRAVVLLSTALALVGAWRSWRARGLRVTALLLMVLPGTLILVTGFGGEVLFRAFLFATPFVSFLVAAACLPRDGSTSSRRNAAAVAVVTAALLPGFLLGYYGKEQGNYFTPDEVRAALWVDAHAAAGSLLVEGSRGYPAQYRNYERFTYVNLDTEPVQSWDLLLEDPSQVLRQWLDDPSYADAYVLLTRSQRIAASPARGPGLLVVEKDLLRDDTFRVVFANEDATVFALRSAAVPPENSVPAVRGGSGNEVTAKLLGASVLLLVLPGLGWAWKLRRSQSRFDSGDTLALAVVISTTALTLVGTAMAVSGHWSVPVSITVLAVAGAASVLPLRNLAERFVTVLRTPAPALSPAEEEQTRAWVSWRQEHERWAAAAAEEARARSEAEAEKWSDWYEHRYQDRPGDGGRS